MKTRKKFILAKIETTYGVDSTPAATDAVLTSGLSRTMYDGNTVTRETDRPTLGARTTINTGPYVGIEFTVELAGAGTAGDVPGYGALLRACGFSETVNAGTDVVYAPVSSGFESVTIHYHRDGERQVATGCRGTVSFEFNTDNYPMMRFRFVGLYSKPTTTADPVPDTSIFQDPLPVNNANTGTCTLGAYNLELQSLTADLNAEIPYTNLVNREEVFFVDRSVSGAMAFLAPTIATEDIMALVESQSGTVSTSALQIVHGGTAGNIVTMDAPAVQLSGLSETDINGEQGYQTDAIFVPSAGDDDLTLTVS